MLAGLRRRLLLALLVTSAMTLAAAAAVLYSPLRDRLREQSANNLRDAVQSTVDQFAPALRENRDNPFLLQTEAIELRQRTDGRVLVDDLTAGSFLYDTDNGANTPAFRARKATLTAFKALREQRTVTEIDGDEVRVAVRLFDRDGAAGVLVAQRRLTEVTTAVEQVRNALLAAAVVGLLVAVALAIALSSTLTRRLNRLRNAALRITDEGIDAPLEPDPGTDEVGDLSRAFARMQDALRRQEAARRSFVATASHELRTPLTMLQGTMELLEEDLRDGHVDLADAQRQVEIARRELLRLSSLAGELLDLSRLDAAVHLRSEPVELGELARAVAAEFALRADDRDVELDVAPPPRPCWGRGDPDAVARVVRILLDNALRYGPTGEPVVVRAGSGDGRAVIEVADHGPGIHPAERELIFERFQRGRSSGSEGGFGLGLAIGRELAEKMGGSLGLAGGDGPGSHFVLALPAAEPDQHAEPPAAPRPEAVSP